MTTVGEKSLVKSVMVFLVQTGDLEGWVGLGWASTYCD